MLQLKTKLIPKKIRNNINFYFVNQKLEAKRKRVNKNEAQKLKFCACSTQY